LALAGEIKRCRVVEVSIREPDLGVFGAEVILDLVEEAFVLLPDPHIEACDGLGFPGVKQVEEGVVDLLEGHDAHARSLIHAKQMVIRLIPVKSAENTHFLTSTQCSVLFRGCGCPSCRLLVFG
jgi:hypothetical protein